MSKYNGLVPTFFRATTVGPTAVACLFFWQAAPSAFAQPSSDAKRVVTAVEKTLQRHAGDVHACFGRALADRLDVSGKLELEVTVGAAGKVQDAEIASRAATVPEGLAACVVAAAKAWRVDDIEQGASV